MKKLRMISMLAFVGLACTASGNELATFGSEKITEANYKSALERLGPQADMVKNNPDMRERFMDHLINNRLLAAKAVQEKVNLDPKFKQLVDDATQDLLAKFYLDQAMEKAMSDENVKKQFEKDKAKYSGKEVKASHILVKDEKTAKDVLAQAQKKGADFGALAKKHSSDSNADKGGDLGFFGRGMMVPPFEEAAFNTPKGEIHPKVVQSQFGFHIIKVTDLKGGDVVAFDTVKDKVKAQMRGEVVKDLLENLRKDAKVSIKTDKLKELKL